MNMSKRSGIAILVLNSFFCVLIVLGTAFFMTGWNVWARVVCYSAAGIGAVAVGVFFFLKKDALFKSVFILVIFGLVLLVATVTINKVGGLDEIKDESAKIERLVEIIRGAGGWSIAVFVLLQILQVVILPLPALVCYIPGVVIFGPLYATLLASLGVIAGSVINYFLGKVFGKKLVCWIAGKETTDKYAAYFGKKGKVIFLLMQILPFFPDDILCMVAGLTSMNFPYFISVMIFVRPFIIAAYCYLGSGTIIPFEGWGIAVWLVIFAVCIALAVLSFIYQERMENWLVSKFSGKKKSAETAEGKQSSEKMPDDAENK